METGIDVRASGTSADTAGCLSNCLGRYGCDPCGRGPESGPHKSSWRHGSRSRSRAGPPRSPTAAGAHRRRPSKRWGFDGLLKTECDWPNAALRPMAVPGNAVARRRELDIPADSSAEYIAGTDGGRRDLQSTASGEAGSRPIVRVRVVGDHSADRRPEGDERLVVW